MILEPIFEADFEDCAGALSRNSSDGVDRIETRRLARIGDQSGEDTRVVNLQEEGASLDFLGFTFRHYEDLQGRGWQYLNVSPSAKALKKEREKLHEMTFSRNLLFSRLGDDFEVAAPPRQRRRSQERIIQLAG